MRWSDVPVRRHDDKEVLDTRDARAKGKARRGTQTVVTPGARNNVQCSHRYTLYMSRARRKRGIPPHTRTAAAARQDGETRTNKEGQIHPPERGDISEPAPRRTISIMIRPTLTPRRLVSGVDDSSTRHRAPRARRSLSVFRRSLCLCSAHAYTARLSLGLVHSARVRMLSYTTRTTSTGRQNEARPQSCIAAAYSVPSLCTGGAGSNREKGAHHDPSRTSCSSPLVRGRCAPRRTA